MSKAAACLAAVLRRLPVQAQVLDAGCGDFRILREHADALAGKRYVGCDSTARASPAGADFQLCDLDTPPLPFADDTFDLAIFSHVIEHLNQPIPALIDLVRVVKPGGLLYVECPSERSLQPGWWAPQSMNLILSFHDDPTHGGHPWSPQGLRRAALYMGCEPVETRYDRSLLRGVRLPLDWAYGLVAKDSDHMVTSWWQAVGWSAFAVIRKPGSMSGAPPFNYRSFKES